MAPQEIEGWRHALASVEHRLANLDPNDVMTWEELSPTSRSSAVLVRNKWFTVEPTVGELRIRLGERALKRNRKGRQPALMPTPEDALPGENVLNEDDELVRAVRIEEQELDRVAATARAVPSFIGSTEGKTRREANRCLKRYLARSLYRLLEHGPPLPPT